MRRFLVLPIVVPAIVIAAVVGIVLAGRTGTGVGNSAHAQNDFPTTNNCPAGEPNNCRDLIARTVHLDAAVVPTIDTHTAGLRFQNGAVVIPKDGNPPTTRFTFAATGPARVYDVLVTPRAAPKTDARSVGTTPGGHRYRISRTTAGTTGLVFFDAHFSYLVVDDSGALLTKASGGLTLAQQLVDAVHPATPLVDP